MSPEATESVGGGEVLSDCECLAAELLSQNHAGGEERPPPESRTLNFVFNIISLKPDM